MKKMLLTLTLLLVALHTTAQSPNNTLSSEQIAKITVLIVDTRTQHTQIDEEQMEDGQNLIVYHFYDKDNNWAKCGVFRDADVEAVEITPKQLKKLKSGTINFAQFVASNNKHTIWAEINKYDRDGHPVYVMDLAEKTEGRIKLYPILGFMATTSDLDHH